MTAAKTPDVCDHGHPEVSPWSEAWDRECWFGHPITTGIATCTCPGSGRERTEETRMSTYEQYLAMVAGCRALYPDQRAGQAHFNVLSEEYPDIADQMATDPFYDDARLPAFLVQVESLMDAGVSK